MRPPAHQPCLVLALVLAALLPTTSAGAVIIGSVATNLDGSYTYSYRVDNSSGLFDIAAWSIEFPFTILDWNPLDSFSGGDVTVPDPNWVADAGIPVTGQSAQDFLSLDPSTDVRTGGILDGFSFRSAFAPGDISYHEFSAFGDSISGTTMGPGLAANPVPDTDRGTAVMGLVCLLSLWGFSRIRIRA